MVVERDDIHAEPPRLRERLETGRAAVDRNQQSGAARGERADRLDIGSVALGDAVGNMDQAGNAAEIEKFRQQRRGTGAVNVIIAENGDGFLAFDGAGEPFRRLLHRGEGKRLRQQRAKSRVEMAERAFWRHAPARQHAGQKVGQAVLLGDGQRPRVASGVEPAAPWAAENAGLNAEQDAPVKLHRN